MPEKKPSELSKKLTGMFAHGGRKIILTLGTRAVRLVVCGIGVLFLGWLLYGNIWRPLHETTLLPPGVTARNPELDATLLQVVNNERIERSQYRVSSFGAFEPLFVIPPAASPTPLP